MLITQIRSTRDNEISNRSIDCPICYDTPAIAEGIAGWILSLLNGTWPAITDVSDEGSSKPVEPDGKKHNKHGTVMQFADLTTSPSSRLKVRSAGTRDYILGSSRLQIYTFKYILSTQIYPRVNHKHNEFPVVYAAESHRQSVRWRRTIITWWNSPTDRASPRSL